MDDNRSTTPPLPPPDSPEILLQESSPSSQPRSTSPRREDPVDSIKSVEVDAEGSKVESDRQSRLPRPLHSVTPEPLRVFRSSHQLNGRGHPASLAHAPHLARERPSTPGTPGNLAPFDWNDLEVRFDRALEGANEHEAELAADFEALMKYFNIWASAASAHDNQRAAKRLQTRSYFVKLKETDLDSKRQNYEQVVQAFQNAMLLLNQAQS